jgi:hypothetical protein
MYKCGINAWINFLHVWSSPRMSSDRRRASLIFFSHGWFLEARSGHLIRFDLMSRSLSVTVCARCGGYPKWSERANRVSSSPSFLFTHWDSLMSDKPKSGSHIIYKFVQWELRNRDTVETFWSETRLKQYHIMNVRFRKIWGNFVSSPKYGKYGEIFSVTLSLK